MNLEELVATASLPTLLLCTATWAQQAPGTQGQSDTTKNAQSSSKEKHWSGSLVDVGCMAKALHADNAASPQSEPTLNAPHFTGGGSPGGGQVPGGTAPGGMGTGQRGQEPVPTTTGASSDITPAQQAEAEKVRRVDDAAKSCLATPSTEALGLATSDGKVVQFDPEGNAKAREALKDADLQPGKKVKAKVTGTMEDSTTVKVASVEVKGKTGKHSSAGAPNPGT